jgi:hypothetical protein
MKTNIHFQSYLANLLKTKVVKKLETHILCSIAFLKNRAIYEVMRKHFVEWGCHR